jgi:hypothetical protein
MCNETSTQKALDGYTCQLFDPCPEHVFFARWESMKKFGERVAVEAMIDRPKDEGE